MAKIITSCRGALQGSPAARLAGDAMAPAAAAPAAEDAELIALCAEFHHGQAIIDAWQAGTICGKAGEAANVAQWAVMERLFALPARTPEGVQVKAAVVAAAAPGFSVHDPDDMVCKMATSLAADVLGRAI